MTFPVYQTVYAAGLAAAAPFLLGAGLFNGKSGRLLRRMRGGADLPPKTPGVPRVWVHGLSLGEIGSAGSLVKMIDDRGRQAVLSSTTTSGFQAAQKKAPPDRPPFLHPLDWSPAVRRTIVDCAPDAYALIETDIWPNLLAKLTERGVPALWLNARVSPRSLDGYRRIKPFWSRVLALFDHIGCQTEEDLCRVLELGGPPDRTSIMGNLKFDRPEPASGPENRAALLRETGLSSGFWLVGGSTHAGEELILLDIFRKLKTVRPDARLLLVPRSAGRFDSVWRSVEAGGFAAARRSGAGDPGTAEVFLLDTLGELDRFYELADLVFIGKSLAPNGEGGGQNPLEAASRGKPILFGPRMHNFTRPATLLVDGGGGRMAVNAAELAEAILNLAADEPTRKLMGQNARFVAAGQRGATAAAMDRIETALRRAGKS